MGIHETAPVPRVVDPDVDLPDDVRSAVVVFGTPLRVAILHILAAEAFSTIQLVDELDVASRATLPRNLAALENAGAIRGLPAHGQRRGRTIRWYLQTARVDDLAQALARYTAGREARSE